MLHMTTAVANRLVLLGPARGSRGRDTSAVRRYRIARLRVEGRAHADAPRGAERPGAYEHLKRIYD